MAGVRELHIYRVNEKIPTCNAVSTIGICKGVLLLGFW